jgi:WD repeat and SOF domain-containing protein 1
VRHFHSYCVWGDGTDEMRCRQRYLPKPIHNAETLRRTMLDARRQKEENRRAHAPKSLGQEALRPKNAKGVVVERVES